MNKTRTLEDLKGLHQFYRDCLSQPVDFPDLGQFPVDLVAWVADRRNTDVAQLAEYLARMPGSSLPENEELALRVMLFTILQANLASDHNNRYPGYTLPASVADNIKRGLSRVLELHPHHGYVAICVQLLYRIKELEEVLALSDDYAPIFAKYPVLQAITGFIHTMLGQYDKGLEQLRPLAENHATRDLPLVGLAYMTCQHFLGMVPRWPLEFGSLQADTADLPRLLSLLPSMETITALPPGTRPVVFVACDTGYFYEHALHLAWSLHATNAGQLDLHLHLYSPEHRVFAEIERLRERVPGMAIGVSVEYGAPPLADRRAYFATARFVRAWQLLEGSGRELCMVDADALFNAGWDSFKARLADGTELVLACPAMAPFWEQVIAGFIWARPTALARHFLAKVAQFILHNMEMRSVVWFTDQVALSAADSLLTQDEPAVAHLDADLLIDVNLGEQALCWAVTTIKKGNLKYDAARERLAQRYA